MKIEKALDLIEKGFTAKILSKLTESQLDVLHSRIISEKKEESKEEIKKTVTNVTYDPASTADQQKLAQKGIHVDPSTKKITMSTTGGGEITTEEMTEDDDTDLVQQDLTQKVSGQLPPEDQSDEANDGMDDDTNPKNNNQKSVGMTEAKKQKTNPWAICTAQLGKEFGTRERHLWSAKEKNKYERCVKDVKQSLKEGKNPLSLFLENQIMRIVERNLPPRITKKDLVNYLSEQGGPAVAPSKPATKPATKPTTKPGTKPTKKPSHPGKNPFPGEKPAPKAVSPDKAKDEVLDLILNILNKK